MEFNMMLWHFLKDHEGYNSQKNILVDLNHLTVERAYKTARVIHYVLAQPWIKQTHIPTPLYAFWQDVQEQVEEALGAST
jgi:hypothetical protein